MAQDDGIDVVFHVAESDADHTYAGLQMLSVVCLEAGVDAKPMSVGSGIAAHRHGNPVPNRVGLRPICNEMRSQITLLQVCCKRRSVYQCSRHSNVVSPSWRRAVLATASRAGHPASSPMPLAPVVKSTVCGVTNRDGRVCAANSSAAISDKGFAQCISHLIRVPANESG